MNKTFAATCAALALTTLLPSSLATAREPASNLIPARGTAGVPPILTLAQFTRMPVGGADESPAPRDYRWSVEKLRNGEVTVEGFAPSQEFRAGVASRFGTDVNDDSDVQGNAPGAFDAVARSGLDALGAMNSGRVSFSAGKWSITGRVESETEKQAVLDKLVTDSSFGAWLVSVAVQPQVEGSSSVATVRTPPPALPAPAPSTAPAETNTSLSPAETAPVPEQSLPTEPPMVLEPAEEPAEPAAAENQPVLPSDNTQTELAPQTSATAPLSPDSTAPAAANEAPAEAQIAAPADPATPAAPANRNPAPAETAPPAEPLAGAVQASPEFAAPPATTDEPLAAPAELPAEPAQAPLETPMPAPELAAPSPEPSPPPTESPGLTPEIASPPVEAGAPAPEEITAAPVAPNDVCRTNVAAFSARNAILFQSGRAEITQGSTPALDELAGYLASCPDATVHVEGHTDADGDEESNLALSVARAEAVSAALAKRGIDAGRLYAIGFGETLPIADNNTADGKRLNRRIVFSVLDEHR